MKTIQAIFNELFGLLKWLISLLKPIPERIVQAAIAIAVLLCLSPLLLSVQGVRKLEPLFAYFIIFLVVLMLVQNIIWPTITNLQKKNPLPALFQSLRFVILRLAFYGTLLLGMLWSLNVLGLQDDFSALLDSLPSVPIPTFDLVIPGVIILLIFALFFLVLRPVFARRGS